MARLRLVSMETRRPVNQLLKEAVEYYTTHKLTEYGYDENWKFGDKCERVADRIPDDDAQHKPQTNSRYWVSRAGERVLSPKQQPDQRSISAVAERTDTP